MKKLTYINLKTKKNSVGQTRLKCFEPISRHWSSYTPWKPQKTFVFPDVLREIERDREMKRVNPLVHGVH